jgi:hypothetical protein
LVGFRAGLGLRLESLTNCQIAAAQATWRSDAYRLFDVTLRRDFNLDGTLHELLIVFTCKTHPVDHKPHFRPRKKTGEGTSNLQSGIIQCLLRRDENRPGDAKLTQAAIPYTEAAHRALIALRCAKNHRPFNSVLDEDYQAEVNMLRPGTKLPHPAAVSRDIQAIYLDLSIVMSRSGSVRFSAGFSRTGNRTFGPVQPPSPNRELDHRFGPVQCQTPEPDP